MVALWTLTTVLCLWYQSLERTADGANAFAIRCFVYNECKKKNANEGPRLTQGQMLSSWAEE